MSDERRVLVPDRVSCCICWGPLETKISDGKVTEVACIENCGFDSSHKDYTEILQCVADWVFAKQCRDGFDWPHKGAPA